MSRPYAEVIGDPIQHSKSPVMHNFWLKKLGIDAEYRATHVTAAELPAYFAARRKDFNWRGCNVTVPHKSAVLEHLDCLTEDVNLIGAANTISLSGFGDFAGLSGYNTDADGFMRPLGRTDLSGKRIGVIGAGGAARAILYALGQRDVAGIVVFNRTQERAARVISELGVEAQVAPMEGLRPNVDLLINATTLGMSGTAPLNIDLCAMPPDGIVYDIVYAPLETKLLASARARGLVGIDGLGMLIGQAMSAFSVFFQSDAPFEDEDELRGLLTS